jgi:hypothetical protein
MRILRNILYSVVVLAPVTMAYADLQQTEQETVQAVDRGLKKAGAFVAKGVEKGADGVAYGAEKTKQGVEKAAAWAGVAPAPKKAQVTHQPAIAAPPSAAPNNGPTK